jgi:hypothetical protein
MVLATLVACSVLASALAPTEGDTGDESSGRPARPAQCDHTNAADTGCAAPLCAKESPPESNSANVETGTTSDWHEHQWLLLSSHILDAQACRDLVESASEGSQPTAELILRDYQDCLKALYRSVAAIQDQSDFDFHVLRRQVEALEAEVWNDLVSAGDSAAAIEAVRRAWMRRTWLTRPRDPCVLYPTGIDLARFVELDWQTRSILRATESASPSAAAGVESEHGSKLEIRNEIVELLTRYEDEMSAALDTLRREGNENLARLDRESDPARRRQLNRERFLFSGRPYAITHRYATRVAATLERLLDKTAGAAWRERFLQANDTVLFKPQMGTELACLDELESCAARSVAASGGVIELAERRWRSCQRLRRLMEDSLNATGEFPPNIADPALLAEVGELGDWVDDSMARAMRSIQPGWKAPSRSTLRWGSWFPPTSEFSRESSAAKVLPDSTDRAGSGVEISRR